MQRLMIDRISGEVGVGCGAPSGLQDEELFETSTESLPTGVPVVLEVAAEASHGVERILCCRRQIGELEAML